MAVSFSNNCSTRTRGCDEIMLIPMIVADDMLIFELKLKIVQSLVKELIGINVQTDYHLQRIYSIQQNINNNNNNNINEIQNGHDFN